MSEPRLIDDIIRADPEFMSVLGTVYKALQTGELKHEDVYAYSRAENIGNFERLVALFDAGNLFRAQKMDFDSWLKAVDYGKATEKAANEGRFRDPTPIRAKKAADKFSESGFTDTVVVDGGTQAWVDAGLPVERGAKSVLPLDRQVQLSVGILIITGVLLSHFVNPNWIWLSGFVGAGLTMAGATGFCPLRNVIAAMPWNQKGKCCGGGSSCCSC